MYDCVCFCLSFWHSRVQKINPQPVYNNSLSSSTHIKCNYIYCFENLTRSHRITYAARIPHTITKMNSINSVHLLGFFSTILIGKFKPLFFFFFHFFFLLYLFFIIRPTLIRSDVCPRWKEALFNAFHLFFFKQKIIPNSSIYFYVIRMKWQKKNLSVCMTRDSLQM